MLALTSQVRTLTSQVRTFSIAAGVNGLFIQYSTKKPDLNNRPAGREAAILPARYHSNEIGPAAGIHGRSLTALRNGKLRNCIEITYTLFAKGTAIYGSFGKGNDQVIS